MELLSDVEGAPENKRPGDGDGEGGGEGRAPSENDKWMRDIWSVQNRAVVMSYFCVGFAIRFLTAPTSYYIVHVLGESAGWVGRDKRPSPRSICSRTGEAGRAGERRPTLVVFVVASHVSSVSFFENSP